MHLESSKMAGQVRREQRLPKDGRNAYSNIKRLEEVFRDSLYPNIPTFDVGSVQGVNFDEWLYTEGLECFMAFTQSVEINARLLKEAAVWGGNIAIDYVTRISEKPSDKWILSKPNEEMLARKVFFPPGNNLGHIINTDNVLRAFLTDHEWILKPHPITSDNDVHQAKLVFGITRIRPKDCSGIAFLKACNTVGYTTTSEMGLMGMIFNKNTVDFSKYEFESQGRYHAIYFAIREAKNIDPKVVLNRLFNCPWSGIIPLNTSSSEAHKRFCEFKRVTLQLRDTYAPLIQLPRTLSAK